MLKQIVLVLLIVMNLLGKEENLHLFTIENVRYDYTATANSLNDTQISYNLPSLNYVFLNSKYIALASFKYSPKQHIGNTAFGTTNIDFEQKGRKYELGAGYKHYLTEDLYIGPALLFSDSHSTLYQVINNNVTKTEKYDSDLRAYLIMGLNLTHSTMLFYSVELKNDLLSNDYAKDYSQYNTSVTLYQFISSQSFLYLKYEQALRDKNIQNNISGNEHYKGYGAGVGINF